MKPHSVEQEAVENCNPEDDGLAPMPKGGAPLMRAKADDLSVWQSVRRYKVVGLIAMAAAFCASLDGYRESPQPARYDGISS